MKPVKEKTFKELKQKIFKDDPELKAEYDKLDDDEYEDPSERDWVKADELYDEIKSGYIDKGDIE